MEASDKEFLEKYHKMVSDIENRPRIFKNLKQGDSFWYLCYSYRGNGKKTSTFKIEQYVVHELSEYHKAFEDEEDLVPDRYVIRSVRTFEKKTIYSSRPSMSDKIGVWREVTEADSIFSVYDYDMNSDIIKSDDDIYCYYTVVAFDKQKAIDAMKKYVQDKATAERNSFEKFIEEQKSNESELMAEYDNILNEIENG